MTVPGFIALAVSFLLNAYLYGTVIRMRRAQAHVHKWTAWSDWRALVGEHSRTTVSFSRIRYCEMCALPERQEVGRHFCSDRNSYTELKPCSHFEHYVGVFDPMYELRQINKDLEELQ